MAFLLRSSDGIVDVLLSTCYFCCDQNRMNDLVNVMGSQHMQKDLSLIICRDLGVGAYADGRRNYCNTLPLELDELCMQTLMTNTKNNETEILRLQYLQHFKVCYSD